MSIPGQQDHTGELHFLSQGGEMGALTRAISWGDTPLGPPVDWPLSLKNNVAMLLASRFPMLIFWGTEMIQFYNDAFYPSLGVDGKHPAIGKAGRQTWDEIWDFIGPMLENVMATGQAVWFEDQLVPFYRNGRIEDIYWTFSYSPLYGDKGTIEGVLVVCCETTDKVVNQKKLEASEERFQNLIHDAAVGIIVLEGEDNTTQIVNEAYLKLIGKRHSEVIGRPIFSVIPEAEEFFRGIINTVRSTGEPLYLNEHPYSIGEGPEKIEGYLNIIYQPHIRDNTIIGVMVLCQDVTQQVLLHKKISHSEQQVRALLESAPFPIGVYEGPEMRITLVNKAILQVWGKGDDVVGKTYFEVLPELEGTEIYENLRAVFHTGKPYHARNQKVELMVEGQLQSYYFNYSFTPLFDTERRIYGVMNTAADVTDLQLATLKTERSRQDFQNLILQAPVAMCLLLGPEHTIELANDYMVGLWGKHRGEVMGKPVFEALPDAADQGLEALLDHVYESGETFTANERPVHLVRFGNPETVYQNFVYEPYRDASGKILGVIAISIEVTEQVIARHKIEDIVKERTEELYYANKSLLKSNEDLAQFAYVASHDLQEPLRKIGMFSQMLKERIGQSIDERSREQLTKINTSSHRLTLLVNDVLAYSQLSGERNEFGKVDLNAVVADIVSDFEMLIAEKDALMQFDALPVVQAQPLQMRQLFTNLISNSLKFSKSGIPPLITITSITPIQQEIMESGLDSSRQYIKIQLCDNGIGLKPEFASKIFAIFQRLHSKSEYEGTGIGLAICKKIVLNHGGSISAANSSENGAVFDIILPVSR